MPNMADNDQTISTSLKLLFIGDSGSGKTGALASLAAAGYKLRIIDLDNGVDILKDYVKNPLSQYVKANPQVAKNIQWVTLTEEMRNLNGKLVPKRASVWAKAVGLLTHWKEGDLDLGQITTWGEDTILVVDSLTKLSTAALNQHLGMNGALMANRTQNEARRDIGAAQQLISDFLSLVTDTSIRCHVIITSHVTLVDELGGTPMKDDKGEFTHSATGYPSAIGRALSPRIPQWFNTVLFAKAQGVGMATRHRIYTRNQGIVNVKSSAPLRVANDYPLETGLADYFKAVRGDGPSTRGSTSPSVHAVAASPAV